MSKFPTSEFKIKNTKEKESIYNAQVKEKSNVSKLKWEKETKKHQEVFIEFDLYKIQYE